MSDNIYADPRNPKIILRVRVYDDPDVFIVGRWDCTIDWWARPVKFAPIGCYPTREDCQRALDRWAFVHGVKAIEEVVA